MGGNIGASHAEMIALFSLSLSLEHVLFACAEDCCCRYPEKRQSGVIVVGGVDDVLLLLERGCKRERERERERESVSISYRSCMTCGPRFVGGVCFGEYCADL